jgi:PBP1b-binding outer membrane lipoprotein LpoB
MKNTNIIAALILLAVITVGCSKEQMVFGIDSDEIVCQ